MRDLIKIVETVELDESAGFAGRVAGEKFKNSSGQTITFNSLDFYPGDEGAYATPEEMQAAVDKITDELEPLTWVNNPATGMLSFGITGLTDDATGKRFYLGRFYKTINPVRRKNAWDYKPALPDYIYQSTKGVKESIKVKPTDLLTNFADQTVESLAQQIINKAGANSDIANAVNAFLSAKKFPIHVPRGKLHVEAFRDYFCEMLQPMAIVRGMVGGDVTDAAATFFGKGRGFRDCTISFNTTKGGGLHDSLLTNPEGKQIKISSKGAGGAVASTGNLLDTVNQLKGTAIGKKLLSQYAEEVSILEMIVKGGNKRAPLDLGMVYEIITPEEAGQIQSLEALSPGDEVLGTGTLSKKLEGIYSKYKEKDPRKTVPVYHMTASLAKEVTRYINEHTQFSHAACDILNHGALVQVYTTVTETKDEIIITNFDPHWPSKAVTQVLITTEKAYWSTGAQGIFNFQVNVNGYKSPAPAQEPPTPVVRPKRAKSDQVGRARRPGA